MTQGVEKPVYTRVVDVAFDFRIFLAGKGVRISSILKFSRVAGAGFRFQVFQVFVGLSRTGRRFDVNIYQQARPLEGVQKPTLSIPPFREHPINTIDRIQYPFLLGCVSLGSRERVKRRHLTCAFDTLTCQVLRGSCPDGQTFDGLTDRKQAWESTSRLNTHKHISVFRVVGVSGFSVRRKGRRQVVFNTIGYRIKTFRAPGKFHLIGPPPVRASRDTLLFLQHPHATFHRLFVPLPFYETPR